MGFAMAHMAEVVVGARELSPQFIVGSWSSMWSASGCLETSADGSRGLELEDAVSRELACISPTDT